MSRAHVSQGNNPIDHNVGLQLCAENEVCIEIGENSANFNIEKLKRLDYFQALFSDRWMRERKDATTSVDTSQKIEIFDKNQQPPFELQDLALLLQCYEMNRIPNNISLDLHQLESLAKCSDFFSYQSPNNNHNNKQSKLKINKNKIIKYLKCRIPPITAAERKQWAIDCDNKLVREAINEYNQSLQNHISMIESNTLILSGAAVPTSPDEKKENDNKKLLKIKFDSDTAARLFKSKFIITYDTPEDNNLAYLIRIDGFDKKLWDHLYGLFDICHYWHYFGNDIATLVHTLGCVGRGYCHSGLEDFYPFYCESEEWDVLENILDHLLEFLVQSAQNNGKNEQFKNDVDPSIPPTVTIYSVLIAYFNIYHSYDKIFWKIHKSLSATVSCLSQSECQHFTILFLLTKLLYVFDRNEIKEPTFAIARKEWYTLLEQLIRSCSAHFLVSNARLWFPVVHKADETPTNADCWDDIVLDQIIPKLNTQLAFEFGLYLVDFIVYCQKENSKKAGNTDTANNSNFDQRYFDFLKNSVGITWNLL